MLHFTSRTLDIINCMGFWMDGGDIETATCFDTDGEVFFAKLMDQIEDIFLKKRLSTRDTNKGAGSGANVFH